ncbi:hypothetical protein V6N13_123580 [Hibiscus sabdariffa]|uniref:RNase H type-1 domain-containing protein n=1 Tax=Hibiscus sabdariffa TaxID=183260 RepID=A0ABR2QTT6_9ROSI
MQVALESERSLHTSQTSNGGLMPVSRASAWWSTPPVDWCKINVDGVWDHATRFTACGGLVCDHNGCWVRGFARSIGVCSPIGA